MDIRKKTITISLIAIIFLVLIVVIGIQVDKSLIKTKVERYLETRYDIPYQIVEMRAWDFKNYYFRLADNEQGGGYVELNKKTGINDQTFRVKIEIKVMMELSDYINKVNKDEEAWIKLLGIFIINEPDASLYLDYRNTPPSYEVFVQRILEDEFSTPIELKIDSVLPLNPKENLESIYYTLKFLDSKAYFYTSIAGEFYEGKNTYYLNPLTPQDVKNIIENKDLQAIEKNIIITKGK